MNARQISTTRNDEAAEEKDKYQGKKETPGKECNEGKEDSYNSAHKKHQERSPWKTSTTQNVETAQEKKKC